MPAASYAPSRGRSGSAKRRGAAPARAPLQAAARVRWDRVGRIAMLFVLVALLFLYLSTGLHMFSTWRQARHTDARVAAMQAEHTKLVSEHNRLSSQSNLEQSARALGMQRPGEQSYIVGGLPDN
jgi:Flp pilus assembly protein TadG